MVKVISAYNFQEQNIYSTTGDITASCLIGSDRLAIAHQNHLIEIVSLKGRRTTTTTGENGLILNDHNENHPLQKIAFPTVDQVEQIEYCSIGNFLVTLESKCEQNNSGSSSSNSSSNNDIIPHFIRVYTNFDIVVQQQQQQQQQKQGENNTTTTSNCFATPMRARIASKVTPKSQKSQCIEVIELPIYAQVPNLIACCQSSGTIAISCGNYLYFYEMKFRSNDLHKFSFIDFFEFPFNIKLEFTPLKLKISEHVIACFNQSIAVAFKVVDLSETNTEDGSTSNSMVTDSSINYILNRSNEPIDFEVAKKCNQVNGVEFKTDLCSNWDATNGVGDCQSNFSEERPILINDIKIDLNYPDVVNVPSERLYYSVRSLVQLRLSKNKNHHQIHDEFRCLALKPIYHKKNHIEMDERNSCYRHIMKSTLNSCCVGFSLFLTTVSDGYLYQFTNQGKWYTENMKCLATYPFTSPVIDVVIDNYVIHAITESGIETFSSRIGHKLFSSYFEYPMMSDPYPNETSPLVDVPICVMGICGFFGVKYVVASSNKLILLSTDKERNAVLRNEKKLFERYEPEWTIYDLQLPKANTLVLDILNLANLYNTSSPDVYFELLEEAHIIARLGRELRVKDESNLKNNCSNNSEHNNYNTSNGDSDDNNDDLENIYMETCQLLADFTIQSERKDIYSQAVSYYLMSKQTIWNVYKKYCEKQLQNMKLSLKQPQFVGLIYTLKLLLSRTSTSKSSSDYLNNMVTPILPFTTVATKTTTISSDEQNSIMTNITTGAATGSATTTTTTTMTTLAVNYEHTFAEELFNLFKMYAPTEIATISLISPMFRDIVHEKLFDWILNRPKEELKSDEKLCLILCYSRKNDLENGLRILETMKRKELFQSLKEHWLLIFDNYHPDNYRRASFSDFTENILFVCDKPSIIEAICDVFIHLLIISQYIDLDFLLKLFMNYFAVYLGHKGYRLSQKILEIILQAYFNDLYNIFRPSANKISDISTQNSDLIMTQSQSTSLLIMSQQNNEYNENFKFLSPNWIFNNVNNSSSNSNNNNINNNNISNNSNSNNNIQLNRNNSRYSEDSPTTSTTVDSNYEDPEFEGLKILFRMYLGLLKQYTNDGIDGGSGGIIKEQQQQVATSMTTVTATAESAPTDKNRILPDIMGYRLAFIDYMSRNIKIIKSVHLKLDRKLSTTTTTNYHSSSSSSSSDCTNLIPNYDSCDIDELEHIPFRRPILFLERRELYLNKMPPFNVDSFKLDSDNVYYFDDWNRDICVILLKLQALLNSGRLDSSFIDDFIAFSQSNPNVIGIDSLITILLPKPEGVEFLIHVNPEYLLPYANCRLTTNSQWQVLFKRIVKKKREFSNIEEKYMIFYDNIIKDILQSLLKEKPLEEFLSCVPDQEINLDYLNEKEQNQRQLTKLKNYSQDGIDEDNPFQVIIREAVAKQRSDALCAMIQSTGKQLFDAVNNYQLHLN